VRGIGSSHIADGVGLARLPCGDGAEARGADAVAVEREGSGRCPRVRACRGGAGGERRREGGGGGGCHRHAVGCCECEISWAFVVWK
jgi:hypothetical protein